MNIKWKDGEGNILNADNQSIKYLDAKDNIKTVLKNEEVKKITIDDGLMNIFGNFEHDLKLTIVIPRKRKREATRIYNIYDKTGKMLKGKSGDFFTDLILESSVAAGNPLFGIAAIIFVAAVLVLVILWLLETIFGNFGIAMARIFIIGYPIYAVFSYILLRIRRKKMAKVSR